MANSVTYTPPPAFANASTRHVSIASQGAAARFSAPLAFPVRGWVRVTDNAALIVVGLDRAIRGIDEGARLNGVRRVRATLREMKLPLVLGPGSLYAWCG